MPNTINKVVYDGNTLIDLTSDTVTAASMLEGVTAHDKSGALITGTLDPEAGGAVDVVTTLPSGGDYHAISGIDLSSDTVSASSMLYGVTAHDNGGNAITGTIETKTSSDLTASGATVTVPAGYYATQATKSVASGTAGTPTATKGTVTNHSVSVTPSVTNTAGYISGGTVTGTAVTVSASELVSGTLSITSSGTKDVTNYASASVASGSATTPTTTITANPSISVNSSGLITATTSATQNITPTVSAGYVSSGTSGTVSVSGSNTEQLTTLGATTYTPTTTAQTISSGRYLTGTQTIEGIVTSNLTAENIVSGVTVKVGTATDDDSVASITGTASSGGNKITVTNTGTTSELLYVQLNQTGTKYYDDDEIYFTDGDTLYIQIQGSRGGGSLYINEALTAADQGGLNYTYTLPNCDVGVRLVYGSDSTVYITIPSITITANGTYDVADYGIANVTVESGEGYSETLIKNYIERNSSFTSMELPSALTTIGTYAFYNCQYLALTSLPSGITSIGTYAFYNCQYLALTSLPSGITSIAARIFYGCTNLALTTLPSGITSIGTYAFYNCSALALTSLPSGITSIGGYAFYGCTSLRSISCEGTITILGASAFTGSSTYPMQLTSASFPNMALTSNLSYVFGSTTATSACQSLAFCDIGTTTGIAANAFANCYALQTLVLRKTSAVATLANVSAFTNTPMRGYNSLTGTVYVPSALISTYQTATNWATLYDAGTVTFVAIEGSEYEL